MEPRPHKRLKIESSGAKEFNLGFGFNDADFSDRVLRLEITPSNTSEGSNTSKSGNFDFEVKKIHINSLLLAYKSPFFYKLFKNGMKETQQKDEVTLRIDEYEEAAFMDLLKFMYDHSVNASSGLELVDVLMAADKFEIPSCVKFCVDLLLKLPMSTELAFLCIELPSSVSADEIVQTLIGSAKSYICAHFGDFTKSQEEAMSLPLCAVELVIGSDGLRVASENDVLAFILKWGRVHYTELEERREILTRLVLNFICLPKMSSLKLKEMLSCSDLDSGKLVKPVMDALFSMMDQEIPAKEGEYPKRIYRLRDVKVVQLQLDSPRCVVYFDLTKKECADLTTSKWLHSQTFFLGRRSFNLVALRSDVLGFSEFSLYVRPRETSKVCTSSDISVMKKSSKEFTSLAKANRTSKWGYIHWKELMMDESDYFIDGILHFRVDITLVS